MMQTVLSQFGDLIVANPIAALSIALAAGMAGAGLMKLIMDAKYEARGERLRQAQEELAKLSGEKDYRMKKSEGHGETSGAVEAELEQVQRVQIGPEQPPLEEEAGVELDEDEGTVLAMFAKHYWIDVDDVMDELDVSRTKAEYLLDRLLEAGMMVDEDFDGSYGLTRGGRAYSIETGLIH